MNIEEIKYKLHNLPFFNTYSENMILVMGAALVFHGIKENTKDIDCSIDDSLYEHLINDGYKPKLSKSGLNKIVIGDITLYHNWKIGYTVKFDDILVCDLNTIIRDKIRFNRPKDLEDVYIISDRINNTSNHTYLNVYSYPNNLRGLLCDGIKSPIIIVNGYFSSNKIGPHRLYYQIERELNSIGFPVIRIDLSAMGESDGLLEETTFNKHISDLYNVIKKVSEIYPNKKVHLIAHCEGCYNVLSTITKTELVRSITLISPIWPSDKTFKKLLGEEKMLELKEKGFTIRKGLYCDNSFIEASDMLFDENALKKASDLDCVVYLSKEDEFSDYSSMVDYLDAKNIHHIDVEKADHNYLEQIPRNTLLRELKTRFNQLR